METLVVIAGLLALGALGLTLGVLMFNLVPLVVQLRKMSAQAERLLQQLNGDLPPLVKQTTRTLENLDAQDHRA